MVKKTISEDTQPPVSLDDLLGRNTEAEESGVWVALAGPLEVKLRSTKSAYYARVGKRLMPPHLRSKIQRGSISDTEAKKLQVRLVVEGLLIDWRGVYGVDGKEIPFSIETATEILSQRKYSEFIRLIEEAADYRETFLAEIKEDDSKN